MGRRTYTMQFRSAWYWKKVLPGFLFVGVTWLVIRSIAKENVKDSD